MKSSWLLPALGFGALTAGAAVLGGLATRKSVNSPWYRVFLRKPPYQPPRQAFGPVWSALYTTIAASGARVWRGAPGPARTRALALWGTQLALNAGWSAVFFGARRPRAALVEIGALLASIAGYAAAARKVDRPAAWLVAPYAAWTAFAAVLNAGIVRRNPQLA
jgi:tryptophan-rich sensory protein